MEFLGKLGETISTAGKGVIEKTKDISSDVAKKTKDLSDTTKLGMQINSERELMNKKFQKMGEFYFRKYAESEIADETIKEYIATIKHSMEQVREYNRDIQYIKGTTMCFVCGKDITGKEFFCKFCGHRTERNIGERDEVLAENADRGQAYMDAEVAEGKVCSKCKSKCGYDDLYCPMCGNQIREEF